MAATEAVGAPAPDVELIQRIQAGDAAAFTELYERYFPRVYHFTRRRLNTVADTEETVQEVFINVFASLGSFRGEAPFAAWVLGVTRRTIASRFKRKRHATVPLEEAESERLDASLSLMSREPTPLEVYECGERIQQLEHTAMSQLSAEQRQLFEMHHLEHHPIHEIARRLAKSEDAVKSNLYRARKLLLAP
jgi:RNA polymerase sigma-70 factor (ECF subfamily)